MKTLRTALFVLCITAGTHQTLSSALAPYQGEEGPYIEVNKAPMTAGKISMSMTEIKLPIMIRKAQLMGSTQLEACLKEIQWQLTTTDYFTTECLFREIVKILEKYKLENEDQVLN